MQAVRAAACFEGVMLWRPAQGGEHLVRIGPGPTGDGRRRETHLGRRSPETEAMRERFETGKAGAQRHLEVSRALLAIQAAANREAGLCRVPSGTAAVLRAIWEHGWLGGGVRVVGPSALYGYEAGACARLRGDGVDPLGAAPSRLALLLARGSRPGLVEIVRRGDPTFRPGRAPGTLVNATGHVVEVVEAGAGPAFASLAAGEEVRAVAVDEEGLPVPFACPPMRAYIAERLRAGEHAGEDDEATLALAQGRAAVSCLPPKGP